MNYLCRSEYNSINAAGQSLQSIIQSSDKKREKREREKAESGNQFNFSSMIDLIVIGGVVPIPSPALITISFFHHSICFPLLERIV